LSTTNEMKSSISQENQEKTNYFFADKNNCLGRSSTQLSTSVTIKKALIQNQNHAPIITKSSHLVPVQNGNLQINNWSSSLQTVLDRPPAKLPQRLIISGIVSCLILLLWAWFGKVEEIGTATGKLIPQGETYQVEPVNSGKVSQINVREGEVVKVGQVLVELDTELATQEVQRLESILAAYAEELSQKRAFLTKILLESEANQKIATANILSQESAIASTKETAATTRQLLTQQQAEILAYHNKQARLKPVLGWAEQSLEQLNVEKLAHQERLHRLQKLQKQGAISQELIFEAQEKLRQIEQQIIQNQIEETTSTQEQLFQVEQSLRELKASAIQKQGDLNSTLQEAKKLAAELQQKQAERDRSKLADRQKIQQLELEITQIQTKITDTKSQLLSAQAQLKQNWLTAPISGTVSSLNIDNVGKVINAGETVLEIAPSDRPLVLSALLSNEEAGFVERGMPVKVKLDAYAYQDYGLVAGKVTEISADAKSDEQLGQSYQIEVALDKNYIVDEQKTIKFKPGQTATAEIIIRHRRILEIFLDPIKKLGSDGVNL
jgi:hemolysin D